MLRTATATFSVYRGIQRLILQLAYVAPPWSLPILDHGSRLSCYLAVGFGRRVECLRGLDSVLALLRSSEDFMRWFGARRSALRMRLDVLIAMVDLV